MRFSVIVCALALIAIFGIGCNAQDANVILRKRIHTEYQGVMAQSHNFTVELNVFNVGKKDAINVTVRENWGGESFEVREGELVHTWPVLPAGANATYNITLSPRQEGEINGFRAIVQYKKSADGLMQVGFSTPMNPHIVLSADRYSKLTAKHWTEWIIFTVGASGVVLIPLINYISLQRKKKKKST